MKTLTFNRCDWSGEEITVEFTEEDGGFRFEFAGYEFCLAPCAGLDDLALTSPEWEFPLFHVHRHTDRYCPTYAAISLGVERETEHPVQTAVQILCNTL